MGTSAMMNRALLCSALLITGTLLAQQPIPVGKVNTSAKNYRAADGSQLSKNSSDIDLESAVNESLADNPEYRNVRAAVHHHHVTLTGDVPTKSIKNRAETDAGRFVGVRSVKNKLKVADTDAKRATMTSSAQ